MSRRASVFARQNPGRRRVRFPDEIVFEESIKESDGEVIMKMLRRASVDIDVDRINMAGMTALHQAVLDNNLVVVRILIHHGAQIDKMDLDSWTPLHAAAANGHHQIAKYLISQGANKNAVTDEGERPIDLVDPGDQISLDILLEEEDRGERDRRMSIAFERGEPAWYRRESVREDLRRESFNVIRGRKGSMWNPNAVDEEDEEDEEDEDDEDEDSSEDAEDADLKDQNESCLKSSTVGPSLSSPTNLTNTNPSRSLSKTPVNFSLTSNKKESSSKEKLQFNVTTSQMGKMTVTTPPMGKKNISPLLTNKSYFGSDRPRPSLMEKHVSKKSAERTGSQTSSVLDRITRFSQEKKDGAESTNSSKKRQSVEQQSRSILQQTVSRSFSPSSSLKSPGLIKPITSFPSKSVNSHSTSSSLSTPSSPLSTRFKLNSTTNKTNAGSKTTFSSNPPVSIPIERSKPVFHQIPRTTLTSTPSKSLSSLTCKMAKTAVEDEVGDLLESWRKKRTERRER